MASVNPDNVKQIFASALDIEPGDRAAFLERTCGTDKRLRREVESWLASYAEAEAFIETPVFLANSLIDQPLTPMVRQLGNYTIISEIGHGGMGAVFLAERSDGEFEQQVAIKIVRQTIVDKEIVNHFRRERQILASLNHPNIARLLDGGVTADGTPFLAMEFVEGETILTYANSKGLNLDERLRLFIKVCDPLIYAHRNLVVHRDLKPANILVNADGEPKLLDFGLARVIDAATPGADQTQTAFRALTPAYASPEQLCGEPVTTSTDIYSLGVVLYELLTNERPFRFEGKSLDEIIKTVTALDPPPPSAISASQSQSPASGDQTVHASRSPNPKLRGDIDNITLMALRKEPERRYRSVEAFVDDIQRYLNRLPVTARANTSKYRASKFVKRHKVAVAAAFLVLASLIGGIAVSLRQTREARIEKAKAEAVSSFMQTMLNASSPENSLQTGDHELTVRNVLDDASQRLAGEDLSNQPEVKAELQRIIGESYFSLGQYDLAEQNLSAALDVQTRLYGETHVETLQTMVVMGSLWIARGENARADAFYRRSIPNLRVGFINGSVKGDYLLTSYCDFAILMRAEGDSRGAEALLRESLSLTGDSQMVSHSIRDNSRIVLALTLADQGKFDDAIEIVREESEAIAERGDGLPMERSTNLVFLGRFQMEEGNLQEAEKNLSDGETIYRKIYSQSKLELGDDLRLEAETFYLENKYAEAENKINEALQIYQAGTSTRYINFPTALMVKGLIYSRTNRADEAERLLRQGIALRAENLPPAHFMYAVERGALGEFLVSQKRFAEAEPILLDSYDSLNASQSPGSARVRTAARRLYKLYTTWNKPELAEKYVG